MALLKGFSPLPIKCQMISYPTLLICVTSKIKLKRKKEGINMWLNLLFRLLFYSMLALLLICSFMIWIYSRFFIESIFVVSVANMGIFTVYDSLVPNLCIGLVAPLKSPKARMLNTTWESLCLTVTSCFSLPHFPRCCFSLRIWFPALSFVFKQLFTLYK